MKQADLLRLLPAVFQQTVPASRGSPLLALLAVMVAFLSATQDIAFDAYSTDVLRKDERAAGAAVK